MQATHAAAGPGCPQGRRLKPVPGKAAPPGRNPPAEWPEAHSLTTIRADEGRDTDDEILDVSQYLGDGEPSPRWPIRLQEELSSVQDSISDLPPASVLEAEWLAIFLASWV